MDTAIRLKSNDLQKVETASREIMKKLKAKYPGLDAYLVYSTRLGQANLGSAAREIFSAFPAMFCDSIPKSTALNISQERKEIEKILEGKKEKEDLKGLDKLKKTARDLDTQLSELVSDLEIDPNVQVELRFGTLDYDLIFALQGDELIDETLTPQTRSSIRIVLGPIGKL